MGELNRERERINVNISLNTKPFEKKCSEFFLEMGNGDGWEREREREMRDARIVSITDT